MLILELLASRKPHTGQEICAPYDHRHIHKRLSRTVCRRLSHYLQYRCRRRSWRTYPDHYAGCTPSCRNYHKQGILIFRLWEGRRFRMHQHRYPQSHPGCIVLREDSLIVNMLLRKLHNTHYHTYLENRLHPYQQSPYKSQSILL